MSDTRYEMFQSSGYSLHVKIQDNRKAENLLLLHGFNDTKETFVFIEDYLAEKFNLLSFDFRGHGNSAWKQEGIYHFAETFSDIHNVASYYFPESFYLMGHSMGGGFAARYAGFLPEKVKALICLEGFAGLLSHEREKRRVVDWLEASRRRSEKVGKIRPERGMDFATAVGKLRRIYQTLPDDKLEILVTNLVKKGINGKYIWKNDPALKSANPIPYPPYFTRYLWESITCPVAILYGEKTNLRPARLEEEVLKHFSNLFYRELPNCGHNLHHDDPKAVTKVLDEFFLEYQITF